MKIFDAQTLQRSPINQLVRNLQRQLMVVGAFENVGAYTENMLGDVDVLFVQLQLEADKLLSDGSLRQASGGDFEKLAKDYELSPLSGLQSLRGEDFRELLDISAIDDLLDELRPLKGALAYLSVKHGVTPDNYFGWEGLPNGSKELVGYFLSPEWEQADELAKSIANDFKDKILLQRAFDEELGKRLNIMTERSARIYEAALVDPKEASRKRAGKLEIKATKVTGDVRMILHQNDMPIQFWWVSNQFFEHFAYQLVEPYDWVNFEIMEGAFDRVEIEVLSSTKRNKKIRDRLATINKTLSKKIWLDDFLIVKDRTVYLGYPDLVQISDMESKTDSSRL